MEPWPWGGAVLCLGNIEKRGFRHFKGNSGCFSNLSCAFVCAWISEKPKLACRELLAIWGPDFAPVSLCTKQECVRRNWQRSQERFELVSSEFLALLCSSPGSGSSQAAASPGECWVLLWPHPQPHFQGEILAPLTPPALHSCP